jgi:signal recognition particle subunit SRP54
MFSSLSDRLGGVLDRLRGKGYLTEDDVNEAMREVRIALLEADVALPVVKQFISETKAKAVGEEVLKSISPAQMVVKIVNDHLVKTLGEHARELNFNTTPPAIFLMAGLQGSGKTTTAAKIALWLKQKSRKRILMASTDIYRPAAQKQLETLGKQVQIDTLDIRVGEKPLDITRRAMEKARLEAYDVLFIDTAGRLHIDDELMNELKQIKELSKPIETLLVVDSLTGQDAVNVASQFQEKIGVTGITLTRVDGDARGGAALSMKAITGVPILFLGVGEKLSEIELFDPERIAGRILGMGDIVALVERASENIQAEEAARIAVKIKRGTFDLNDLNKQLSTIKKMGGVNSLMKMMPGVGKIQKELDARGGIDEKMIARQQAIIFSMTNKERENPDLLNSSRKLRIASGSGTSVQEINQLLKQFKQMQKMMKTVSKMGKKGLARGGLNSLFGGAG